MPRSRRAWRQGWRRARDERVRHLVRRAGRGRRSRHLADLRAEPGDVHRRIAVRVRRRDRRGRTAGGPRGDRLGIPPRRAQRRLRHADVAGDRHADSGAARPPRSSRSTSPPPSRSRRRTRRARTLGFWVTGIAIYVGWNLSTLAGALLGDVLGDPRAYGLDAAAAAAFLALLWPRLRHRQPIAVGHRGRRRGDDAHARAHARASRCSSPPSSRSSSAGSTGSASARSRPRSRTTSPSGRADCR